MLMPTEFKRGMTILFKGVVHEILNVEHVRPGKGGAFARVKMKNLDTQSVIEDNFSSKEKVEQVITEKKFMEFLYRDKDLIYLMDKDTFEQIPIGRDKLERIIPYLRENETVTLIMYKDKMLVNAIPRLILTEACDPPPSQYARQVRSTHPFHQLTRAARAFLGP